MRKIIYRGQRIDNKEWIQGNLFVPEKLVKGCFVCPETNYADFLPCYENGDDLEKFRNAGSALGRFIPVDPKTVGQYTGLKNRNGKEIYEGDILQNNAMMAMKFFVTVVFNEGCFCYSPSKEKELPILPALRCLKEAIIIGNVHDNPELLTQV